MGNIDIPQNVNIFDPHSGIISPAGLEIWTVVGVHTYVYNFAANNSQRQKKFMLYEHRCMDKWNVVHTENRKPLGLKKEKDNMY